MPQLDKHVEEVRRKLLERSQTGLIKYGTTLERTDLTELQWLVHAQEEAMDMANYLEVLIDRERKRLLYVHSITTNVRNQPIGDES